MGDRSATTLTPLYERLEQNHRPLFYATDDFAPYHQVLPPQRHAVGKELTFTTEQHNSDTRHWLARFRRKSKVVSHSEEMIRLSVIAIEYVHKGGGLHSLLNRLATIF